jgi:hypothetical protein
MANKIAIREVSVRTRYSSSVRLPTKGMTYLNHVLDDIDSPDALVIDYRYSPGAELRLPIFVGEE